MDGAKGMTSQACDGRKEVLLCIRGEIKHMASTTPIRIRDFSPFVTDCILGLHRGWILHLRGRGRATINPGTSYYRYSRGRVKGTQIRTSSPN